MKYANLRIALLEWKGDRSEIEAAAALGVAPNTLGNWTDGSHLPPGTRLPALAAALGMSVEDLRALVAKDRKSRRRSLRAAVQGGAQRAHANKSSTRGGL